MVQPVWPSRLWLGACTERFSSRVGVRRWVRGLRRSVLVDSRPRIGLLDVEDTCVLAVCMNMRIGWQTIAAFLPLSVCRAVPGGA